MSTSINSSLSEEERLALTRHVMHILDSWRIPGEAQVRLLALPADTKPRHLDRYRKDTVFPDAPELWLRVEHLLGIAEALYTTFPHDTRMGAVWMQRKVRRFRERTPLSLMLEDGMNGIISVRTHLDCTYDWGINR
jgi:hypothetical protein